MFSLLVAWSGVCMRPRDLQNKKKDQIDVQEHHLDSKREKYEHTCAVGVRIFSTIESIHFLMIPRFSHHSGNLAVDCKVTMESFQPWRTQEWKKDSSFGNRFPFSTESDIRRNLEAQRASTRL